MREHPILFSGPMVRAILEGRKTQTRRIIKPYPQLLNGKFVYTGGEHGDDTWPEPNVWLALTPSGKFGLNDPPYYKCPYGQPGDRLWVRETFCHKYDNNEMPVYNADGNLDPSCCYYSADGMDVLFPDGGGWTPSIHMPRWASRILLNVETVRAERLLDVGIYDVAAEGVDCSGLIEGFEVESDYAPGDDPEEFVDAAKDKFRELWDSINGKPRKDGVDISWSANPWVWVVEFERIGC